VVTPLKIAIGSGPAELDFGDLEEDLNMPIDEGQSRHVEYLQ
jgi:hypothetical protein